MKYQRVYAAIDLDAVRQNLLNMKRNVPEHTMLCAVVKTDGYGHGAVPVARAVSDLVWGYATATIEEALNLRQHGIRQPILVLGYVPVIRFPELIEQEIRYCAFEAEKARELSRLAQQMGRSVYLHLKVDTGMSRVGVRPQEAVDFARLLNQLPGLKLEGIFTHFATADMTEHEGAYRQAAAFRRVIQELEADGISIPIRHCGNSAAILWMPDTAIDMMRAGIALYGMLPSEEVRTEVALKPALSLYSRVAYLKTVPAGTPVSYGATYVTNRTTRIATIPVGYGDGYPRALSNCGQVLIRGKRVPIIGRVCMDQFMVDVTELPEVLEEDPVVLIGRDQEEEITVEELTKHTESFSYEFVCDLGKRIPRVYYQGGRVVGSKDYFEDRYEDFAAPL